MSNIIYAQKDSLVNIFEKEKFSIEVGVGVQNGALGIRGKYFYTKYLGSSVGVGSFGKGLLWNICFEARTPTFFSNRISPFYMVMYGSNTAAYLVTPNNERENASFTGFSTGLGIKINVIKEWSSYLSLGVNYRFISDKAVEFVDEFNQTYGTDESTTFPTLFPVLSFTYCFK